MIRFKINGALFEEPEGLTIIEAADRNGIHIPRFCYHPKLSIAANCRMCLVSTSTSPKPLPACVTPLQEGMEIFTENSKTQNMQKEVLEFLLINHPLDCPVCDQAGECELQDMTLTHGAVESHFHEHKREVPNPNLGPLVATEMNRCIHCTRCVRFGQEIAGKKEIGMFSRGERSYIATYNNQSLESSLAGNIIDLCPVGALTSKPSRYRGRSWQYEAYRTVSFHDGLRSRLMIHCYQNEIRRITSVGELQTSDYWLSDRDRFGIPSYPEYSRLVEKITHSASPAQEEDFYGFIKKLTLHDKRIDCIVPPFISYTEYNCLKNLMLSLNLDARILCSGMNLQYKDAHITWDKTQADALIVIGSFLESHFTNLYVEIRNFLGEQHHRHVYHIAFYHESVFSQRYDCILSSPQEYLDHLKALIVSLDDRKIHIVLCQQLFAQSSIEQSLVDWMEENHIHYYLVREQAPYDADMIYDAWDGHDAADLVLTLHIEQKDLGYHPKALNLIQKAKAILCLTSYFAEWDKDLPVTQWPCRSPWEGAFSYKTFWQEEKVLIEPLPLQSALHSAINLQEFFNISSAGSPSQVQKISTLQSDHACTEVETGNIRLLVLKNPAQNNMFIRRALPFLKTPVICQQQGVWVSPDLAALIQNDYFLFKQPGEMTIQLAAQVRPELAPQTIILWDDMFQKALSIKKFIYSLEDLL